MPDTGKYTRCQCGKLYLVAAYYVGDQSVCYACRSALDAEYARQQKEDGRDFSR